MSIQPYLFAGKIAAKVREEAVTLIRPGAKVLDICQYVESRIEKLSGRPAFPCNISINHIAAHDTAGVEDEGRIQADDVVKLDLGVQIDGYIVDTALTVSLGRRYAELVAVTERALRGALEMIKEGITVGEIGALVEATAKSGGFKAISNLGGHNIERFQIHGGITIPNVRVPARQTLKRGGVYAVEPFLTTREGTGQVRELPITKIYSLVSRRRLSAPELNEMEELIWSRYRTLPFTSRWLIDTYGAKELEQCLAQLARLGILRPYPVLMESNSAVVAQFEHTITLTDNGILVLTA